MSTLEITFTILGYIIGIAGIFGASYIAIFFKQVKKNITDHYYPINAQLGIIETYETRDIAIKKNWELIRSSNDINILNFKGYSLINPSEDDETRFELLLNDNIKHSFKFLLLDPSSTAYIKKRIDWLGEKNSKSIEDHQKNIKDIIEKIRQNKNKETSCKIECRLFSEALKWSLILLDHNIFISFYLNNRLNKAPCFLLNSDSILGTVITRHFNDIWDNKSKDALTQYNKYCIIALVGGSYMGKSIIAHHLAEKYDFSGVICTDMIRNQLLCETQNEVLYSTSTPTMKKADLDKQQESVSNLLLDTIEIYKKRGEKIIVEGMHFTDKLLNKLNSFDNCLILGIDNTLPLKTRLYLKRNTTRPNCRTECTIAEEQRMSTIHSKLIESVRNKGTVIQFTDIDFAKKKCEEEVEKLFSKI